MIKTQNEMISFVGDVKHTLCKNEFYTHDRMDTLLEFIRNEKGDISNYISSFSIDYIGKTIHLQFRKTFMKKVDGDPHNSLSFYNIIDNIMKKFYSYYKTSIYSIMHMDEVMKFFSLPPNLFYYLGRIGENTIIINL